MVLILAGQIGPLSDLFSVDTRADTAALDGISNASSSGESFQNSFDKLNAEWPAESPLAQQLLDHNNNVTDISALAAFSDFGDSVNPKNLISGPGSNFGLTSEQVDVPFGSNPDTSDLPTVSQFNAQTEITPSNIESRLTGFNPRAINGQQSTGPIQDLAADSATVQTGDAAIRSGQSEASLSVQDPIIYDISAVSVAENRTGQIPSESIDLPAAPPQHGPAFRLSQSPVTAFTPFKQNAAAVLSTSDATLSIGPRAEVAKIIEPKSEAQNTPQPDLPIASPQQDTPQLATNALEPAKSPLPEQDTAAVLQNSNPDNADASASQRVESSYPPETRHHDAPKPEVRNAATDVQNSGSQSLLGSEAAQTDTKQISATESSTPAAQSTMLQTSARAQAPSVLPLLPQNSVALQTAQMADIPNVLSQSLSLEDGSKQVTVQLDPPELGRVSIDFKFDGNVLQSVLVTGETPEAMRQLRLMHFELVQTLESLGFTDQELEFSQREDQQNANVFSQDFEDGSDQETETVDHFGEPATYQQPMNIAQITSAAEGLNLKL